VAEHSSKLGHQIKLQNTAVLARKTRQMNHILREATKIECCPDNEQGGWLLPESGMEVGHL
jgi:hypothetical protein